MAAINLKSVSFKTLSALSTSQRAKVFNSRDGRIMFSLLTPTEFASLFPSYYKQQLPDVSGFMKAMPSSYTRAKQKMYEEQLEKTVEGAKEGRQMGDLDETVRTKIVREYPPLKKDKTKPSVREDEAYGATEEEKKAYKKVQDTPIEADSPEAKIIEKLGPDKLKTLNVEKYTDPKTNKEMYRYSPPKATDEEAKKELFTQTSGGAADKKALDLIRRREGFRELADAKSWDVNHYRIGYGSDTITFPDGTFRKVRLGDRVTKVDAERDLLRRMPEFQRKGIIQYVGQDSWNRLNSSTKAALTSLAYNYGSIEKLTKLREAIKSGDKNRIADAIYSYRSHNEGKNSNRREEEAEMVRGSTEDAPPEAKGPGDTYTQEQIDAQKNKINESRPGKDRVEAEKDFLEMHKKNAENPNAPQVDTSNLPPSAGAAISKFKKDQGGWVQPASKDVHIQPGNERQCVTLSRAFNNELPNVGTNGWKVSRNDAAIQPGVVVATNMYNSGRASAQGQGFHTGVALTRPDKKGNFWMLDQSSGGPAAVRQQNVNNYNYHGRRTDIRGNFFGIVNGNTKQSREAIAMALNNPGSMPKEVVDQLRKDYDTLVRNPQQEAPAEKEKVAAAAQRPVEQTVPQSAETTPKHEDVVVKGTDVTDEQGKVQKGTVERKDVPAAKTSPNKYKVNQAGFLAAIRATPQFKSEAGIFADAVPDSTILEGFNNNPEVKAAGVYYDAATGTMHLKNPNDPRVKEVMAGFDTKKFMTPIEEKKKEQPKPVEPPPVAASVTVAPPEPVAPPPAAPEGQTPSAPIEAKRENVTVKGTDVTDAKGETQKGTVERKETPPAPPAATAPEPPKKEEPPPAHAGGGREKIRGSVSFAPMDPKRGDNTLATDSSGKQFTLNRHKEKVVTNPQSDTVQIQHRSDIGYVSAPYESGKRGVHTISSGKKDKGGVSYGTHQLASKTGTMAEYLRSPEGSAYAERFRGLKPGSPEFSRAYDKVATDDPEGFAKSQHSYITRTHYEPVLKHATQLGYKTDDPRVQEALYSMSVQHGGAKKIVSRAAGSVGGSPEQQVKSLFAERKSYVAKHKLNFDKRYNAEQKDVLAMDINKYKQAPGDTQVASAADKMKAPTQLFIPPEKQRSQIGDVAQKISPISTAQAAEGTRTVPGAEASAFVRSQLSPPSINDTVKNPPPANVNVNPETKAQGDFLAPKPTPFTPQTPTPPEQSPMQQQQSSVQRSSTTNEMQPNRSNDMIPELLDQSRQMFKNPSSTRAFARSAFGETGDVLDGNKNSYGNNNVMQ